MKKLLRFLLICTLTIGLSACESNASNPQTTGNADADYLGKYLCTGITLDGLTMNPNGKWLELNADGTVTTFLTEEADEAEWKLEGENFYDDHRWQDGRNWYTPGATNSRWK